MPRRRMIDPGILSDESLGECSIQARYLFTMMLLLADDEGRLSANPKYLRKEIFGYDDISIGDVADLLQELRTNVSSISFYEVDNREYAWFVNWERYQKIDRAYRSSLPEPPGYATTRTFKEWSTNTPRQTLDHSPNDQRTITDQSSYKRNGKELKGTEGKGTETNAREAHAVAVESRYAEFGASAKQIKQGLARNERLKEPDEVGRWGAFLDSPPPSIHDPVAFFCKRLAEGELAPAAKTNGNGHTPAAPDTETREQYIARLMEENKKPGNLHPSRVR